MVCPWPVASAQPRQALMVYRVSKTRLLDIVTHSPPYLLTTLCTMGISFPFTLYTTISPICVLWPRFHRKSRSPLWKAGSMLPERTTTIGEGESVTTDRPFHNMKAVERTRAKLRTWVRDCRGLPRAESIMMAKDQSPTVANKGPKPLNPQEQKTGNGFFWSVVISYRKMWKDNIFSPYGVRLLADALGAPDFWNYSSARKMRLSNNRAVCSDDPIASDVVRRI